MSGGGKSSADPDGVRDACLRVAGRLKCRFLFVAALADGLFKTGTNQS